MPQTPMPNARPTFPGDKRLFSAEELLTLLWPPQAVAPLTQQEQASLQGLKEADLYEEIVAIRARRRQHEQTAKAQAAE